MSLDPNIRLLNKTVHCMSLACAAARRGDSRGVYAYLAASERLFKHYVKEGEANVEIKSGTETPLAEKHRQDS